MAYKIEKRSATTPTSDSAINFSDRNYSVPLCGCSNYTGEIAIGDIIGVKLSANKTVRAKFTTYSTLLSDDKTSLVSEQFGSYRPEEEHLFMITKICKTSKFEVAPYFLDTDKVISKQVDESFDSEWNIPVGEVDKFILCEEMFMNKSLTQYSIAQDYGYFSKFKVQKLFALLDTIDESNRDTVTAKAIRKLFPLDNYATSVFHLPKEGEELHTFYNNIHKYEPLMQHYFGEECSVILEQFGTYELVEAHMDSLYESALRLIGDAPLKERVSHRLRTPSKLSRPTVHHNITTVKYNEIFRVYKADPTYVLCKTKYVSNWGGVIVDNLIRSHFASGNIVRVLFGKNPSAAREDKYDFSNVIYCRLLQRLSETQYLACVENMYCSEYEDIVLVVHSGAVSEVPFEWEGNENLIETDMDRDEGEGFGCTGGGAAVPDKGEGEVEGSDAENVTYPLNYDALLS